MHGPINVKFPNNISKWQVEFNSAFKGLKKRKLFKVSIHEVSLLSVSLHYNVVTV
jgi:hypothetical protein